MHQCLIFFIEKLQTISTSQSLSKTVVLVFHAQYLRFWEQWLKEIFSHHLEELIKMFCFMVIIEENPVQLIILKRYNDFKCALQQRWKLRPICTKI